MVDPEINVPLTDSLVRLGSVGTQGLPLADVSKNRQRKEMEFLIRQIVPRMIE